MPTCQKDLLEIQKLPSRAILVVLIFNLLFAQEDNVDFISSEIGLMADLTGQDIGRYHIVEELGQGGMATVYKAYDTRLEREVAIKVIRMETFGSAVVGQMLKRFEREGKSLAKLMHPNIVPIFDYGEHEGSPYLVMAFIPGGKLKNLTGRPMPNARAARLLAPVARALAYAHSLNVIHRDVKPANILITGEGEPMLSDFGVAKILESDAGSTLTGTGVGVGTPEYMAPEQWLNLVVPQTDIYALGVVFYELVTGRKPYTADTPAAVFLKQANDPLPRPRQFVPDLPDQVEQVIHKALAKKPEDRYASMSEFATVLEWITSQFEIQESQPNLLQNNKIAAERSSDQEQSPSSREKSEVMPIADQSQPVISLPEKNHRQTASVETRFPPGAGLSRAIPWKRLWLKGGVVVAGLLLIGLAQGMNYVFGRPPVAPAITAGTFIALTSVKPLIPTNTQTPAPAATLTVTTSPTETITATAIPGSSLTPVSTQTVTPDPNLTSGVQLCAITRNSDSTLPGYLDILHFSARQNKNDLILIYTLRDLPEMVPSHPKVTYSDDPEWVVSIDLDNNPQTGDHEGNEYLISLHHMSTTTAQKLVSIQDLKANLLKSEGDHALLSSWTEVSSVSKNFNFDKKTIILTAHLPERLAENSKITLSGYSGSAYLQPFTCPRG